MKLLSTIKSRFVLAFILVAVIPTVFMSIYSSGLLKRVAKINASQFIEYQFNLIENFLKSTIESAYHELVILRDSDIFKLYLQNQNLKVHDSLIKQYFKRIMERHPEYLQLRYLNRNGHEVLRIDRKGKSLVWTPIEHLQDKSAYYYFQEIKNMSGKNSLYVSKLDLNVEFNKIEIPYKLVTRVGVKIEDNGLFRGCLIINIDGNYFINNVMTDEMFCYIRAFLFNEDKLFITKDKSGIRVNFPKDIKKYFNIPLEKLLTTEEKIFLPGKNGYYSVLPIKFSMAKDKVRYWWFVLFNSYSQIYAPLKSSLKYIFLGLLAIFLFIVFFAYVVSVGFEKPIRDIVKYTLNLRNKKKPLSGIKELDEIVNAIEMMSINLEQSKSEIEQMNRELEQIVKKQVEEITNLMESKIEYERKLRNIQAQLTQADRLASLGLISAKLAHEIGNPLAGIKTALQVLKDDISDENEKKYIEKIILQVDKLAVFLKTFTNFASQKGKDVVLIDIRKSIVEIYEFLNQQFSKRNIKIEKHFEGKLTFFGNELTFKHIIFNILLNCFQELEKTGGTIYIYVSEKTNSIIIEIFDTGKGVKDLTKIFDPFYTTKKDGSGLGLSVVKDLVEANGWEIFIENKKGFGFSVKICIPKVGKKDE